MLDVAKNETKRKFVFDTGIIVVFAVFRRIFATYQSFDNVSNIWCISRKSVSCIVLISSILQ